MREAQYTEDDNNILIEALFKFEEQRPKQKINYDP